jgi:hypothetical protein
MSDLLRVVRWLLRRPQPEIGRERAIQLACEEFDRRDWPYERPTAVERLRVWRVWMDSRVVFGPIAVIDQQTGEVMYAGPSSIR